MRGNPFGPGGRLRNSLRVNRIISQRIKPAKGVAVRRAPLVILGILQIKPIFSREGRKAGKEIIAQARSEGVRQGSTISSVNEWLYIVQIEGWWL